MFDYKIIITDHQNCQMIMTIHAETMPEVWAKVNDELKYKKNVKNVEMTDVSESYAKIHEEEERRYKFLTN